MNLKSYLKNSFIPHEGNDHKPHFFKESVIATIMAISLFLFVTSFGSSFIVRQTSLLGNVYSSVLVAMTNDVRAENNEKPLTVNPLLEKAAALKAADMVSKNYFAHVSPEGITPWYWFGQAGYKFVYAGENLAVGFEESEDVNQGWLNSPTHKDNILNINFTEIGIATAEGVYKGRNTTYVVQMFGSPKAAPIKPAQNIAITPTTPRATTSVPTQQASVLSAETSQKALVQETEVKDIYTSERFAVVQSSEVQTASGEEQSPVVPTENTFTWYEKVLVNEPLVVNYILTALMAIIGLVLVIYLVHEARIRHYRHFAYGIFLFAVVTGLMLMNKSFIVIDRFVS